MAFRTMEEVIAWTAERDDPELALRNGLAQGVWADDRSRALASEWIRSAEAARSSAAEAIALDAATRSANAAVWSARWAGLAAFVAIAALIAAAWPSK